MLYRTLGRTGLGVSLAGLGTGGASRLGQGTGQSVAESHRVVHTALDLGINLFDTSPAYGGSEELLGGALSNTPRDRYVIATKFQPHKGGALLPAEALDEQLETSLRLLRVDALDVLEYHAIAPDEYTEVIVRYHEAALRAKRAGKVRFLGITETVSGDANHAMLAQALRDDLFDVIMVKYGILNQQAEREVFPLALEHNVGVLIMASVRTSLRNNAEAVACLERFIAEGLLPADAAPALSDPLGLTKTGDLAHPLTRAAYQFAAAPEAVSSVLIGTGNADHLRANVSELFGPPLTPAQFAHLRQTFGHLAWNS